MLVRVLVCLFFSQHLLCAAIRSVCFDEMRAEFRCFDLWSPYTNTFFHLPDSPSAQKIQFKLYTVHNRHTPDLLDPLNSSSLTKSHWNLQLPSKVIVHGFTRSSEVEWVRDMVKQLLKHAVNVIAVDWSEGAKGPNYFKAVANCRVVGAQIASLILTAEQLGSSASQFHVIGHSLGAQIAGYVGSSLQGRLGRISGLDAAAPLFEDYDEKVRLDKTDALFVDVIHTDTQPLYKGGLGIVDLIGHIDFFPNGGTHMPGCPANKISWMKLITGEIEALSNDMFCDHSMAPRYYVASINDNKFLSYPCHSADGSCRQCASGCANMGYYATADRSGLFVTTTKVKYPY